MPTPENESKDSSSSSSTSSISVVYTLGEVVPANLFEVKQAAVTYYKAELLRDRSHAKWITAVENSDPNVEAVRDQK